ncbi:MAG: thiamine-phosphate pyrophosphorylase [Candidatus Omnitrophica bacterium]|nr:thiamine-phosphate pyrophosphorylase [Candidatus Omnitrophota bacterium]
MDKVVDKGVYRIIDANFNRVMEGMRVCEDILRFSADDAKGTAKLKSLRHSVYSAIKKLREDHLEELVSSRDVHMDIGKKSIVSEKKRKGLVDLFLANSQRGKESLRVLEEVLKLFDGRLSEQFKKFRFSLYSIEKTAVRDLHK